jgi:glycosyltransferase involved in cell wall biosynthesis
MLKFCLVSASNSESILKKNLLSSDIAKSPNFTIHIERGSRSAAVAYNRGLDATSEQLVVFAHQDVYLPPRTEEILNSIVSEVENLDPNWALIAPFGISYDGASHCGDVWSTSLGRRVGLPVSQPTLAQSFDELTIILRRGSGLRFDQDLPNFHLYGTDIVQTALASGLGAYIVNIPIVHNDKFHGRLGADFVSAYHYVRRKWSSSLPLRTPVVWIDRFGLRLMVYRLRAARSYANRKSVAMDTGTDPRIFSSLCGWENNISIN